MQHAAVEHGSSRVGIWLAERRWRVALWIAAVEGLLVAVEGDVSRWTVIGLAIVAIAFYFLVGQELRSPTARRVAWIAAASQALAVLVVVVAFLVGLLALVAVGILAAVAVVVLFTDRG